MGFRLHILTTSVLLCAVIFQRGLFGSDDSEDTSIAKNLDEVAPASFSPDLADPIKPDYGTGEKPSESPKATPPKSLSDSPPEPPGPRSDSYQITSSYLPFHAPLADRFWSNLVNAGLQGAYNATITPPYHLLLEKVSRIRTEISDVTNQKPEEDMPPFDEWRQQKLQLVEKEKSDHPVNHTNGKRRPRALKNTNYASVVCGAKMVGHNAEAENPGAILTSNPDEYMLNPCKARKYFIVELCDSIHIHGFEIGNLELFSNVPKLIQVSGSARFPTRDWTDFGRYEMKDSRKLQNYSLPSKTGFVKYIRAEMLEHYGKEHYCPISLFRVFGTSMVEEYVESVDDDDDDNDASAAQEPVVDEDAYMERDKWGQAGTVAGNGFGHGLTDMVVSFVKKVSSSGFELLKGTAKNSTPAPCGNATADVAGTRINDTGFSTLGVPGSLVHPNSPLLNLCFDRKRGWESTSSVCRYIWSLLRASKSSLSFCPGCSKYPYVPAEDGYRFPFHPIGSMDCSESTPRSPVVNSVPLPAINHHETSLLDVSAPSAEVLNATVATGDDLVHTVAGLSAAVLNAGAAVPPDSVVSKPPFKEATNLRDEGIAEKKRNISSFETAGMAVPVSPPVNATPGQKESVFVRLGNRLKTLELNMSLSGQYLQELSRRFKKQGEESGRNFSTVFAKLSEATKNTVPYAEIINRLIQLEHQSVRLENELLMTKEELRMVKVLVPALSVAAVIILSVVGIYLLRRYTERLVLHQLHRSLSFGGQNGLSNGHVSRPAEKRDISHGSAENAQKRRKGHKRVKSELVGDGTHRMVPG